MMMDIIDNEEIDRDTVTEEELQQQFNKQYKLASETTVRIKGSYINKLHVNDLSKIAVTLQDNSIEVFELNNTSLSRLCRLSGHHKTCSEVVFHPLEPFLLFSTGWDGIIKLWDIRVKGTCVQEYKEDNDSAVRPYECMDVSDVGNLFCSGSQLVKEDAFIVFWDPRSTEPLGGYWESHTDDITQVKFKPDTNGVLASGSSDGLLNIFNLVEQDEDEALLYSLNAVNTVDKITWIDSDRVSTITQASELYIWNVTTGDMIRNYSRDKVARSIKRSRDDDCYLVDTFLASDNTVTLLAGSHGGDQSTLRSVVACQRGGRPRLQPASVFRGNQQVVRALHYDRDDDLLITAGEAGLINVWRRENTDSAQHDHR
ncbi:unnamed protein product [Leptidea sinapis]|uniref:WD repeat-containing protein 89 n=1 Tax=Leptidea sinapis TaxID=189913 RepID=A0A5E4QFP6_9NEOP|nr:unnamed protein product [Leptidea sinapis]